MNSFERAPKEEIQCAIYFLRENSMVYHQLETNHKPSQIFIPPTPANLILFANSLNLTKFTLQVLRAGQADTVRSLVRFNSVEKINLEFVHAIRILGISILNPTTHKLSSFQDAANSRKNTMGNLILLGYVFDLQAKLNIQIQNG